MITVQGHHSAWYPAERATVTVAVQFDGAEREAVFAAATAAAEHVREAIVGLHDATKGPITWWAADSIRVWSQRPWNDKGAQLDPVHYAALELTAKFSDFDKLSSWIESVVSIDGANVSTIEWALTDAKVTTANTEVRSRAVKDAVAKAAVYAQSIGLGSVTATAIADPGMLGDASGAGNDGGGIGGMPRAMAMKSYDASGGAPLALKPEQIEIAASVDARFIAE